MSYLQRLRRRCGRSLLCSGTPLLLGPAVGVPLFFQTNVPPDGRGQLDSVAIWVAPNPSSSLLLVTDKTWDFVEVHNAATNTYLGRLGGSGSTRGRFHRPNGVAVAYGVPTGAGPKDLLFVVERDNNRVSVFALPRFFFFGQFGTGELRDPYGIAIHWEDGAPQAWITNTGQSPDRIVVYDIVPGPAGIEGLLRFSFPVENDAVLESIVIDPVTRRALVCDEGARGDVMVYDLQGNLVTRFGSGLFTDDPEGIVLYDLGRGRGYILVADQNSLPMEFEVFDRQTYAPIRRFTGPTWGTDGIALTQLAMPNLPRGSLFAVHADRSVHAYDWAAIAAANGLCVNDCRTGPVDPEVEPPAGVGPPAPGSAILSSHPNPFNPSTTIRYRVDAPTRVHLEVYDSAGQRVTELVRRVHAPGEYQVSWHGRDKAGTPVPTGIYLIRMTLGSEVHSHKVTLLN